jgi:flagellar basal-body rod modification protein FlgD
MNVKLNTKLADKPTDKLEGTYGKASSLDAQKSKEFFDGKDMGQVLNEIADKNYVDPKKMRKPEGKMDKDAFMKLMLTQLKYQDPMNPLQSHEMAAQLAQFSQVEQLSNIDQSVKSLKSGQDPMANYQALNFIGKSVSADTEKIMRNKGDTSHELRFQLPENAKEVTVKIMDETGEVVKTVQASNLTKGINKLTWNGTKNDGYPAFSGNYTMSVEGVSERGAKITGQTKYSGVVTGLNYTQEGPILLVGDQKVKLSDVKTIEDLNEKMAQEMREGIQAEQAAAQAAAAPKAPSAAAPQKKDAKVAPQPAKNASAGAPDRPQGNINKVPMSGELQQILSKETKGLKT